MPDSGRALYSIEPCVSGSLIRYCALSGLLVFFHADQLSWVLTYLYLP